MAQRQPTDAQIDAAKRILAHDHKRTYAMHSKGATIRAIQIYLASQGYEPGRFDGDWGEKTQAAWDALKADRGWTYTRATPKALADISKEMGQPLPRARPKDAGQFIGGHGEVPPPDVSMTGSADAMSAPPVGMDVSGKVNVPPQPAPAYAPDPNEFGPDMLSLERTSYNPIAAEAQPPEITHRDFAADFPPMPSGAPDQGLPSNDQMRNLVGLSPAPPAPASPPADFGMGRFSDGAPEMPQGDGSFVENLGTAMFGPGQPQTSPAITSLREALIKRQGPFAVRPDYPAPNEMNASEALRRALVAERASKMAGR